MAIKIFSQAEASKAFPKEDYEKFDPFQFLIVGNRSEIQKAISVSICIDGEQVPIGTVPEFEYSDVIGSGYQTQIIPDRGPIHVIVWGEGRKGSKGHAPFSTTAIFPGVEEKVTVAKVRQKKSARRKVPDAVMKTK